MVSAYSKGYPSKSVNLIACIKSTTHFLTIYHAPASPPFIHSQHSIPKLFFFLFAIYRYVAISIVPSLTSLPCDLPTWSPAQHNAHLSSHTLLILIFLSDQRFFKKKKSSFPTTLFPWWLLQYLRSLDSKSPSIAVRQHCHTSFLSSLRKVSWFIP